MKPYSESCEQNRAPILQVLKQYLSQRQRILEIGSGTGQHAVYFAAEFPHAEWITSDLRGNHAGIRQWLMEAGLPNIRGPLTLDVDQMNWPVDQVDAVFSANTAHIMRWLSVKNMIAGVGRVLTSGGEFCLYGPFNYHGTYTSESNAQFDMWLKQRDPYSGIRHCEALQDLAADAGLTLVQDHAMPANNRTLVWRKI
jgi:cyclopropane fatty-acyl-phospholipid synthase-like methyltransferase